MDVAVFYWISWMIWIYVVFFYNEIEWRPFFSIGLLGFIFLSDNYVKLQDVAISWAFILMWSGALWFLMKARVTSLQMIYMILFSFMLAGIQLFMFVNPVWSLFPTDILLIMLSVLLFKLLDNQLRNRIMMFTFFASTGSFIRSYFLYQYGIIQVIGSTGELIFIMKGMFIFLLVHGLQVSKQKVTQAANQIKMRTERIDS
ncbi:hypothetical protein [Thalassobacillus devorans]|uniref:YphA family membrane protein n=1 Tax=Thalassobacillus devorans TaxID=279813 RepID=UPI00048ACD71|nr:hypothetical protein [Thalassobacillus devorans]